MGEDVLDALAELGSDAGGDAEPEGFEDAPWVEPEAEGADEEPWDFELDEDADPDMDGYAGPDPEATDEGVAGEDATDAAVPLDATDLDVPEEADGDAPTGTEGEPDEVDGEAVDDDGSTADATDGGSDAAWDEWGEGDPDWDATLDLPDAGEEVT